MIVANKKSWAANAYISHYGEIINDTTAQPPCKDEDGIYHIGNKEISLRIGNDEYILWQNMFGFSISKNQSEHWTCHAEPSSEFDKLVELSLPLWEKYTSGDKYYGE